MMDNIKIDRINALAHKQKKCRPHGRGKSRTGEAAQRVSGCGKGKPSCTSE